MARCQPSWPPADRPHSLTIRVVATARGAPYFRTLLCILYSSAEVLRTVVSELERHAQDVIHDVDRAVCRRAVPVVRPDDRPAVERGLVAVAVHGRRQGVGQGLGLRNRPRTRPDAARHAANVPRDVEHLVADPGVGLADRVGPGRVGVRLGDQGTVEPGGLHDDPT